MVNINESMSNVTREGMGGIAGFLWIGKWTIVRIVTIVMIVTIVRIVTMAT